MEPLDCILPYLYGSGLLIPPNVTPARKTFLYIYRVFALIVNYLTVIGNFVLILRTLPVVTNDVTFLPAIGTILMKLSIFLSKENFMKQHLEDAKANLFVPQTQEEMAINNKWEELLKLVSIKYISINLL